MITLRGCSCASRKSDFAQEPPCCYPDGHHAFVIVRHGDRMALLFESPDSRTAKPCNVRNRFRPEAADLRHSGGSVSGSPTLVPVMQSAHLRDGDNSSALAPLHRPWFGRVLLQRQMRAGFVVISQEPPDLPTQRLFIKDYHV